METSSKDGEEEKLKPLRIKLRKDRIPLLKNRNVNWSVFVQEPFMFKPIAFTTDIEGLKPKAFSQRKQLKLFQQFLDNPLVPATYCLVSAPNDGQAKLLGAWMMQYAMEWITHNRTSANAMPLWHDLMGGFENKLVQNKPPMSMLVVNNVGCESTAPKIEKLRDILETFTRIPRIVIATGCDPYHFFTKHLYLPLNGLVYLTNSTVKKAIDI